jgi:nucleoid-associated protein YgaU
LSTQKGASGFVIGPQFAASSLFWNQAYHCGGAMGIFDDKNASDKTKADFSDVTSGASTSSPTPATTGGQSYTVKSGDSLSKIAKHFYGDANEWHRIYDANKDKIKNPDLIHPGQEFTIPAS